jgi:hypothetical protein
MRRLFYRTGAPVPVTLTATNPGGSGVVSIQYTIGTAPDDLRTAPGALVYNPLSRPTLEAGERIRYVATDDAGNAEIPSTSAALTVLADATNFFAAGGAGPTGAADRARWRSAI